jgi:hypothetical protein
MNGVIMKKNIVLMLLALAVFGSASAWSQTGTLIAADYNDDYGDETGLFLDLTAINDVSVVSFDLFSAADTGGSVTVEIYARPGSHVGFDSSSAGWELIGSFSRQNNDGRDYDTFVLPSPLGIPAGDTMGIYAYSSVGGLRHDDRTGPETWADDNLSLVSDFGSEDGAFSGNNDNSMNFAGNVSYMEGIPRAPTSVPTLSTYGLILTFFALLLVASRRFSRRT